MPQGINTGEILEALNDKMDRDAHNLQSPTAVVIETYSNGTEWYRVWSDGWCEQGGQTEAISAGQYGDIVLLKQFIDTNYSIQAIGIGAYTASGEANHIISIKDATYFRLYSGYNGSKPFSWEAKGYIS